MGEKINGNAVPGRIGLASNETVDLPIQRDKKLGAISTLPRSSDIRGLWGGNHIRWRW